MKNKLKALFKMSSRHILSTRNIFVLIAIILTSVLFTVITTMFVTVYDVFQESTFKQTNNKSHSVITYIDDESYNKIARQSDFYDTMGYEKIISDNVLNKEFTSRNCVLVNTNKEARNLIYTEPTTGKAPEKENEIAMDTKLIELLGLIPELGKEVILEYSIKGTEFKEKFIISGYWNVNEMSELSLIHVSDEFVSSKSEYLNSGISNIYASSTVFAYLMFDNSKNIERDTRELLKRAGLDYLDFNINWAYMNNAFNRDIRLVLFEIMGILAIIFIGYLLINNIYQISIVTDMKFYGLLKVIGFINRQIRQIILIEAFIIALIGIIIGQVTGFLIGKSLVPTILNMTEVTNESVYINPNIFVFSSIFVFATVGISITKPCRIIKKISPIEATNF